VPNAAHSSPGKSTITRHRRALTTKSGTSQVWAGDGGEGAKFWLGVLTEIKNRGVEDVCIVVCDGLKGLPESINTTWELAVVQTCIIHYADVRIMPMGPVGPWWDAGSVLPRSA